MKRGLTVAVAGAAILAAWISGCSSNKPTTSGTVNGTTVTIDGKNQNVSGQTACTTVTLTGLTTIRVGGEATGISAVLNSDNRVISVDFGTVNGVTLGYPGSAPDSNATATKNGNSYKITGIATGVDTSNPTARISKPFEIDVTCS